MNYLLDPKLSYKAKGIMTTFLEVGYESREQMLGLTIEGKASYQAGLNELKDNGYVELRKTRSKEGYIDWELVILKK